jgi:hypothetical protein
MNSDIVLQKYDYYRGPQPLGEMWTMKRDALTLKCTVATHRLGWELRLAAGSSFSRSQVCRSESDVFDVARAWRDEASAKGWS